MSFQRKITQISCSVSDHLGGPTRVIKDTRARLESNLVIFGELDECIKADVFPSIFNNRYGIPRKFIWNKAVDILRSSNVILIHGFYTFVTLFSLLHGRQDSKYFLMPHGSLEDYESVKHKKLKYIFRGLFMFLVRNRNFIFAVASEQEKISVRRQFPNLSIEVLGLGTECSGEPTLRRGDFTTLKLVCISRIATKKRIDLCIGAVKLMRDLGIDAELHILGTGEYRFTNLMKELARMLNLEKVVHFHGHLNRKAVQQILPQMHIFLLPSENENFAVAVAEAISDGLPTIVSDNVAIHDFVESYTTGIVISELSIKSLTEAILVVRSNIQSYSMNAINSRMLLSWDEVIKNWNKVLWN